MNPKDNVVSEFPHCAQWKHQLWIDISKDAKTKGSFPHQHFDDAGMIKPYIREYHRLYAWLADCDDSATFDGLAASWEYKHNGKWELYFLDTEDWLHVRVVNDTETIALKPAFKRKLGRGGMVVPGLVPESGITSDDDLLEVFQTT